MSTPAPTQRVLRPLRRGDRVLAPIHGEILDRHPTTHRILVLPDRSIYPEWFTAGQLHIADEQPIAPCPGCGMYSIPGACDVCPVLDTRTDQTA